MFWRSIPAVRRPRTSKRLDGDITTSDSADSGSAAVIRNAGTARINNAQLFPSEKIYEPPLNNSGQMWLTNVSFKFDGLADQFKKEFNVSP